MARAAWDWIFLPGQTSSYRKTGSCYVFSLGLLLVGGLGLCYHRAEPEITEIIPEMGVTNWIQAVV